MLRLGTLVSMLCVATGSGITAQTTSAAATMWLCKDGAIVATSALCTSHGGGATAVHPASASNAPPRSVAARCKDQTTEFFAGDSTCAGHDGLAFTFPASGLTPTDRAAAEHTDSLRQRARLAKCRTNDKVRRPAGDTTCSAK